MILLRPKKLIKKFFDIGIRSVITLLSFIIILWISVFLYASLYYNFVPSASHIRDVHFRFNPACQVNMDNPRQYFPFANVSLYNSGKNRLLTGGQPYKVTLLLEMPESEVNRNIGMFSITVNFINSKDQIVSTSTRSVMLRYESFIMKTVRTFMYFTIILAGFAEEMQTITVVMYEEFLDHMNQPVTMANIEIKACKVQIYKCKMSIEAKFSGLRYLMYYWPILSALIGIGMSQCFLFFIAFLSWYRFLWPIQKKALLNTVLKKKVHGDSRKKSKQLKEPKSVEDSTDKKVLRQDTVTTTSKILDDDKNKKVDDDLEDLLSHDVYIDACDEWDLKVSHCRKRTPKIED